MSNKDDERLRKTAIAFLKDFADKGYENAVECIDWLEKQSKVDVSNNEFKVTTGLYKCVKRMFDGTPDGKLLFEVGNIYKCLSKHDRAEFEVSYGHSVYLEDPVVCKHFIPFETQGKQKPTDNEEKFDLLNFIRKETGCGLAEANNALLKLIKVLKQHPVLIMDKSCKLKIEWEE